MFLSYHFHHETMSLTEVGKKPKFVNLLSFQVSTLFLAQFFVNSEANP